MRTAKLVIGIISMVLFGFIVFQSCATGVVNVVEGNNDASGSAGMFLALGMLIAGIVGVATLKSKVGGMTAGAFYTIAALIGFANLGTFSDLIVWSTLSLVFGAVFIIGSIRMKPVENNPSPEQVY